MVKEFFMNTTQTYVLTRNEKLFVLFTLSDILFIFTYLLLSIFQQKLFRYVELSALLSALILYALLFILSLLFAHIETRQFKQKTLSMKNSRLFITNEDQESSYPLHDLSHVIINKLYYFLTPYHKVTLLFAKNKKVTSFHFLLLKEDAKKLKAHTSQSILKK
jgi:hypothetical protein